MTNVCVAKEHAALSVKFKCMKISSYDFASSIRKFPAIWYISHLGILVMLSNLEICLLPVKNYITRKFLPLELMLTRRLPMTALLTEIHGNVMYFKPACT